MGFYDDMVVPYCIELSCGIKDLRPLRERAASGLSGRVLEVGFGSGLNLPYYPRDVVEVLAVDPSGRARHIGRKRIERAPFPVRFVGLVAERIELDDDSADCALCTFTLCTIPEPERALAEVRRVLKPGGRLHYLEHGRAPDAGVVRWQERLNGVQRAAFGGCNLNRDVARLLEVSGFRLSDSEQRYLPRTPRTHGYVYAGTAVPV